MQFLSYCRFKMGKYPKMALISWALIWKYCFAHNTPKTWEIKITIIILKVQYKHKIELPLDMVSKRALLPPWLTLFTILNIVSVILLLLSFNDFVIPYEVCLLIAFNIYFPPMLVFNCKFFMVARKSRRNNEIPPETKRSFSLKNVSSCVLAVSGGAIHSRIGLHWTENILEWEQICFEWYISYSWARTIFLMNWTSNCLIFCWKNKILRTEGMKLIEGCRRVKSLEQRIGT